jgi:KipI family sensor histidine kinase inhibitor
LVALEPLGDRALLARFASEADAANWAAGVRAAHWTGIVDVVLAYETAAVFADPDALDLAELENKLRTLTPASAGELKGSLVKLPVLYDGEDLSDVADRLGLKPDEVINLHSGQEYTVFAIGFRPGYPYAGYLPRALSGLPRRESPRLHVPAGSVGIVGRQTGVYPEPSPGGWHLIGRTPLRIVNLEQTHFPIRAGDRLRFVPIDADEFNARLGEEL